ncbi:MULTISPECIES: STAS domain-containing protein [Streptomyces]|uniref:STAS domain-containing protein n=1 Tax=Streptomyces TaxID=1883 RepID=UPI00163D08B1|nr:MULTISPECIES: STAS domain-containing protein [Streptomyces]MBC2875889.1 anti-sigma factor antagonist [Streptomyces sp. TYQ1024]UBI37735.1 anti-sigma factor antagonist [Streptomyces mobaraensis]UKW30321.1 anti-sigma factor antagonist [Streptomyces sp. TYQ1024]
MGGYELAFTMRERVAGGAVTIELSGEIDILAEQELGPRLEALAGRRRADLVIDLRGVTFLDASGLRLLLRARNRVARGGGRLRVVRGGPRVSKVIRIVRLEPAFHWLDAPPGPPAGLGVPGTAGAAAPEASGAPGAPVTPGKAAGVPAASDEDEVPCGRDGNVPA